MKETRKKGVGKMIEEANVLRRGLRETATIVLANMLGKEKRIKGCIGDPNQNNKLSFIRLKHQINHALQSSNTDKEVVSEVIWSMHSSLRLNNILEMKKDLILLKNLTSL